MSAPKGNNFWTKRAKHGVDAIFTIPKAMQEAAYEYFVYESKQVQKRQEAIKGGEFAGQLVAVTINNPFTLQGLCLFLDVNTKYFNHFDARVNKALKGDEISDEKRKIYEDFTNIIARIYDIIDKQKIDGALVGIYNATITSRLTGLVDKTETALTGKDGGAIETNGKLTIEVVNTALGISTSEKDIQERVNDELE